MNEQESQKGWEIQEKILPASDSDCSCYIEMPCIVRYKEMSIIMPRRKVKGGYKIKGVPGISPTKEQADRRLRAIKAAQSRRKKKR